ncbi:MAG: type II toxin-antitoxin system CcdA family antitoxin [Rhizobiales bacterium]|nr:type II toxin-antitoxin system CcdA family antitoxin [Hyphomicrobiales bacterium]
MQKVVLELDSEAVQAAEAAGLNLSSVLLEALYRKLPDLHAEQRRELRQRWLEENREAIEAINRRVEENGFVFSDGARTF